VKSPTADFSDIHDTIDFSGRHGLAVVTAVAPQERGVALMARIKFAFAML